MMQNTPSARRRTPYRANACDYDPSPWPTSMLDGVPGSDRHGHEARTPKGLDHNDQLWHTCHARWWSSPSAGFPTPTSYDGPPPGALGFHDGLSVHPLGRSFGCAAIHANRLRHLCGAGLKWLTPRRVHATSFDSIAFVAARISRHLRGTT